MPDPALGEVDVVVEEHVPGAHRLQWIVAHDRLDQRAVRTPGELAHGAVVDAGAEVVRVANHRRPRGTADRGLHLALDAGQAALHDLDEDGIYRGVHGWLRRTMRLPRWSTVAVKPGCSGTVA